MSAELGGEVPPFNTTSSDAYVENGSERSVD
jgi:hypothetical protein